MKKILKTIAMAAAACTIITGVKPIYVRAADSLKVTSITANTKVGDGQREVESFEITVNDASLLKGITAEDFDIINNVNTKPFDVKTNTFVKEYEDDGISLEVEGNKIKINVKAFDYTGKYNMDFTKSPWKVNCAKNEALSFDADDVALLKTKTLDDAVRGTFTYAGLTRQYALYIPKNEDGTRKTNVPLVVWNHGGGEYAGKLENTLVANRGLTAWPEAGYESAVLEIQVSNPNYSFFTAASEERKSLIDQNNALQAELIKKLINEGTVDKNRVYVTGASSGGGASMRFVMQYPELFAGVIACCSMDPIVWVHQNNKDSYETIVSNFEKAFQGSVYTWDENSGAMITKSVDTKTLINLPIYFTHAENDATCNVNSSKAMYEALKNLGAVNNKLTIWSDEEMAQDGLAKGLLHWSWVKVFNHNEDGSPMNWMFKQVKLEKPIEGDKEEEIEKPEGDKGEELIKPVEEVVVKKDDAEEVKTGNKNNMMLAALLLMLSASAVVLLSKKKKAL